MIEPMIAAIQVLMSKNSSSGSPPKIAGRGNLSRAPTTLMIVVMMN